MSFNQLICSDLSCALTLHDRCWLHASAAQCMVHLAVPVVLNPVHNSRQCLACSFHNVKLRRRLTTRTQCLCMCYHAPNADIAVPASGAVVAETVRAVATHGRDFRHANICVIVEKHRNQKDQRHTTRRKHNELINHRIVFETHLRSTCRTC
jgi:hypothetical protein